MIFSNTDKEITIIYYSEDHIARQIIAYAQIEKLPIHDIDIKHTHIPGVHWAEFANRLGVEVKHLINTEDPDFLQKFKGISNLCDHDWLKLLEHNPDILRAPIVMKGEKIVIMTNPQDMLHFV